MKTNKEEISHSIERKTISREEIKNVTLSVTVSLIIMVGILLLKYMVIHKREFTRSFSLSIIGITLIYLVVFLFFAIYVYFNKRDYMRRLNKISSVFGVIVFTNLLFVLVDIFSYYALPLITGSMLVVLLVDRELAFLTSICLFITFLATFLMEKLTVNGIADLIASTLAGIIMSVVMLFFTKRSIKRLKVLFIGLAVSILMFGVTILINMVIQQDFMGFINTLPYMTVGCVGGVLAVMFLQPLFEFTFNLVTDMRLIELTDYKHPLLTRLMSQAPGTFHHSLTVANLAETCAAAIGENVYLARAGAIYHDVGKLKAPMYFKENQSDYNPHDELTPEASVNVIAQHTIAGSQIATEYRIPEEVKSITLQHHGTMPIAYFYHKAQKMTENELDINQYRYLGPLPRTKIAAIVMICDASEAAVRTLHNPTKNTIDSLIKSIIDARLSSGQFDDCDLTMNNLYKIRKTLDTAFAALYHQRIEYPDQQK